MHDELLAQLILARFPAKDAIGIGSGWLATLLAGADKEYEDATLSILSDMIAAKRYAGAVTYLEKEGLIELVNPLAPTHRLTEKGMERRSMTYEG